MRTAVLNIVTLVVGLLLFWPASAIAAGEAPLAGPPRGEPTDAQRRLAAQLVTVTQPDYELTIVLANKLNPFARQVLAEPSNDSSREAAMQSAERKVLTTALPELKAFFMRLTRGR